MASFPWREYLPMQTIKETFDIPQNSVAYMKEASHIRAKQQLHITHTYHIRCTEHEHKTQHIHTHTHTHTHIHTHTYTHIHTHTHTYTHSHIHTQLTLLSSICETFFDGNTGGGGGGGCCGSGVGVGTCSCSGCDGGISDVSTSNLCSSGNEF